MNILEKMQALQGFAKEFLKRKCYLENLNTFLITNQVKECDRLQKSADFALSNLAEATAKLEKYQRDRLKLEEWVPANQAQYDVSEAANCAKVQKLAEKIQAQIDEAAQD